MSGANRDDLEGWVDRKRSAEEDSPEIVHVAFWRHDQYPGWLHGKIGEFNRDGTVTIPSYGWRSATPVFVLHGERARRASDKLDALRSAERRLKTSLRAALEFEKFRGFEKDAEIVAREGAGETSDDNPFLKIASVVVGEEMEKMFGREES